MILSWTLRARADLDRIWLFLAERDVDVADRIDLAIRTRTERLTEYPRIGRAVARDIREWTIVEIHYVVTYRLAGETVWILRVHHAREDRESP